MKKCTRPHQHILLSRSCIHENQCHSHPALLSFWENISCTVDSPTIYTMRWIQCIPCHRHMIVHTTPLILTKIVPNPTTQSQYSFSHILYISVQSNPYQDRANSSCHKILNSYLTSRYSSSRFLNVSMSPSLLTSSSPRLLTLLLTSLLYRITTVTVQYNTIQYNTIQYNTIQYNTITVQYNTIQYSTIQYNTCSSHTGFPVKSTIKSLGSRCNTLTWFRLGIWLLPRYNSIKLTRDSRPAVEVMRLSSSDNC